MERSVAVGLCFLLVIYLYAVTVDLVSAPPLSHGYICGLVSSSHTDVCISKSAVNVIILPECADGENLTHIIEFSSFHNITNTADHEVYFTTSYVRCSWTPQNAILSFSNSITIEENTSLYDASITYNISTLEELPESIVSRYPQKFFSSYPPHYIDIVSLTLTPFASLILSTQTLLSVKCIGNYYDLRYGLDLMKLSDDSALLDGCFEVTNISSLVRTEFLNSQFRNVNPGDDSLLASWSISTWDWESQAPYPGLQIDDGVFSEYLGVQLWQSEYLPLTYDSTSTTMLDPTLTILPLGASIAILAFVLLLWQKRSS